MIVGRARILRRHKTDDRNNIIIIIMCFCSAFPFEKFAGRQKCDQTDGKHIEIYITRVQQQQQHFSVATLLLLNAARALCVMWSADGKHPADRGPNAGAARQRVDDQK